ncbi:MAG: hypothetical protein JXA37_14770 [Chloroflexia bacterium]|nr:hypothetical protein [Chloroflexia bacterium]
MDREPLLGTEPEDLALRVAWRNRARSEALPDAVWQYVRGRRLQAKDPVLYIWLRKAWRPHQQAIRMPRSLPAELFRLQNHHYRNIEERLGQVGLISTQGIRGRGGGTACWLHSLYEPEALLDKHAELRFGHYDQVHHGLFLPFGELVQGQVVRYFERGPDLSIEAAGIFLYLLHLANTASPYRGQEPVNVSRRELEEALGLRWSWRLPELEALEHLGWLHRDIVERKSTVYEVTEAPGGLLELLLVAGAANLQDDMRYVDIWLDAIERGETAGQLPLRIDQLGWQLSPAGRERLQVEMDLLRLAPPAGTSYAPANLEQERIQRYLQDIGLGERTAELIARYGLPRVWDVVEQARQKGARIENPAGWVLQALREEWRVPRAPREGLDFAKYGPNGAYGDLFE